MTHPAPVQATPQHRPLIDDADFTLYVGDAISVLRSLPDESVHCCVTSPPYFGLRDYGTGSWAGGDPDCDHLDRPRGGPRTGAENFRATETEERDRAQFDQVCGKCGATRTDQQLGLEPTPEAYVARMVEVFREVRRVLRKDGCCFLNLGDSYASNPSRGGSGPGAKQGAHVGYGRPSRAGAGRADGVVDQRGQRNRDGTPTGHGLKEKDLVGIPWRVAFALQADGWYLRSEIIWAKPNPMPESVTDRPTKSHEQVFLLTREPRYYFDHEAIREGYDEGWKGRLDTSPGSEGRGPGGFVARGPDGRRKTTVVGQDGSEQHRNGERWPNPSGRNARSVWTIATQPYAEAHFATFPEELPRRCIAAGTSEYGCCPVCGAPWERETTQGENIHPGDSGRNDVQGPAQRGKRPDGKAIGTVMRERHEAGRERTTTGWRPTCDHGLEPTACVVLDPFSGAGTVALVARKLGRRSIGIELNPEYAALAARRLQQLSLLA